MVFLRERGRPLPVHHVGSTFAVSNKDKSLPSNILPWWYVVSHYLPAEEGNKAKMWAETINFSLVGMQVEKGETKGKEDQKGQ